MTITIKNLIAEMLATPNDDARALVLSDPLGNRYGQVTFSWEGDTLHAVAAMLPNGYEGRELGVEDMATIQLQGNPSDWRDVQAQDIALQLLLWGVGVVPSPDDDAAAMTPIGPICIEVETKRGAATALVSCESSVIKVHVSLACEQPSLFLALDQNLRSQVVTMVRELVEGEDLPRDIEREPQAAPAAQALGFSHP